MWHPALLPAIALFATALTACVDGPASTTPDAVPVAIEAEPGAHLMLMWQSVIFEDPNAGDSPIGPLHPGTLVPIANATANVGVDPAFHIYQHACDHFSDACNAQVRAHDDAANWSLAALALVNDLEGDGTLQCTLATADACMSEVAVQSFAAKHLLLYVHAAFVAEDDLILNDWGITEPLTPGVWLMRFESKEEGAVVMPLDGEAIVFGGARPPNIF